MPKTITLEINDEMIESLERYLDSNRQTVVNTAGAAESVRMFNTVEDFFQHNFGTLMMSVAKQFPSKAMITMLQQHKDIDEQMLAASKPALRPVVGKS